MAKIPTWGYAAGAVGIGAAFFLYKKHEEQTKKLEEAAEKKEEGGEEQQPYIAGVTNPYEEYPYSLSGGGAGAGGQIAQQGYENQNELHEFFTQFESGQQEFEKTQANEQAEFQRTFAQSMAELGTHLAEEIKAIGSGGGAPSTNTAGTTPVGPPPAQNPSNSNGGTGQGAGPHCNCPPGYTTNPTGSPGCCYQTKKCGNGCDGHFYKNGSVECQVKNNKGQCYWP